MAAKKKLDGASAASPRRGPRLTDAETWDALWAEAELERIAAMTPEESDAEMRALGGDPDGVRARARVKVAGLLAERSLDWRARAQGRREAMDRQVGPWPALAGLSRAELLSRLAAARNDPRLTAPLVAAFRKRTEAEATDDELRAILEEIEVLRRMHDDEG